MIPRGGRNGTVEQLGDRIRNTRIERGLSQEALAALCPPYTRAGKTTARTSTWLSNIENGKFEPSMGDLRALAENLQVSAGWLLTGEASGDTEFLARLRGMEPLIDDGGQRTVLAVAVQQVEETRLRNISRSLSADEAELIRLLRELPAEQRERMLQGTRRQVQRQDEAGTQRPVAQPERRRAEPA